MANGFSRACGSVVCPAVVACLAACTSDIPVGPSPPPHVASNVFVGAGDIGWCGTGGADATARLLDNIPGTVFTAGDNAYPHGRRQDFADCYAPTWGRHRARTRPTPGNHDYNTPGAAGYFEYFGERAGPPGLGYYSFTLGDWHVVSLNSNVSMSAGSAQDAWLRMDLATNPAGCTLAYWHHPLFSSSRHGNDPQSIDTWRVLYESGADLIVNGHDHVYERFAPQTPAGVLDTARGIRQFTVGTGGAVFYEFVAVQPNSEMRDTGMFGVLKLTLGAAGYGWEFIGSDGGVRDSGTGSCVP